MRKNRKWIIVRTDNKGNEEFYVKGRGFQKCSKCCTKYMFSKAYKATDGIVLNLSYEDKRKYKVQIEPEKV